VVIETSFGFFVINSLLKLYLKYLKGQPKYVLFMLAKFAALDLIED